MACTFTRTYMSLLVKLVVGELEFVEVNNGVHPVRAQGWGVRVNVEPGRRALLLEALHPCRVLVLVAVFVDGCHVHEEDVMGGRVEVKELYLERREHPSVRGGQRETGT